MSHHVLEVRQLRHVYADGTVALHDVSFRILHGEAVAIVGANGAGKSTLLLHLNGSLSPASGEVLIGNITVNKRHRAAICRTVGMVFQNPDDQLFMPTTYDDVAFGLLNRQIGADEVDQRVTQALACVDAVDLKEKPPYRLSAGEKKRVAIATVLAMRPDILVLDEPTSGLDPRARRQLITLLRGFHHTRVITSHDLDMVVELCERTIVLHEGRMLADGPTRKIFRDSALLAACHLEKPLSMQSCSICSPNKSDRALEREPALVASHVNDLHDHLHDH